MKLLLDMNMSPHWLSVFESTAIVVVHWSQVGRVDADDDEIMRFARSGGYAVLTHDLDFGIALALSGERGPSVIQLRDQDILPGAFDRTVIDAITTCEAELREGALLTIDAARFRVTTLPLRLR